MSPQIQVEKWCRGKRSNWLLGLGSYFHLSFSFWLHITSAFLQLISSCSFLSQGECAINYSKSEVFCTYFFSSASFPPSLLIAIKHNEETIRNNNLLFMDKPSILVLQPWKCVNCGKPSTEHLKSKIPLWTSASTLLSRRSYQSRVTSWLLHQHQITAEITAWVPSPARHLLEGRRAKVLPPQRISSDAAAFVHHHPRRLKV